MSADFVTVVDVTARDTGCRTLPRLSPPRRDSGFLEGIRESGFHSAEAASFIHPRWVPLLSDAEDVMAYAKTLSGVEWIALIPNLRGLERALKVGGMGAIIVVCSASEDHNRANLNRSRPDTLAELAGWSAAPIRTASECAAR